MAPLGRLRGKGRFRRWSRPAAAAACVLLFLPLASASTYSDPSGRFEFEYPAIWSQRAVAGVDVSIVGPSSGGIGPSIVATHGGEPGVLDGAPWLLSYAQASAAIVEADLNATEVKGPATFRAASGRLAADYAFERSEGGLLIRQRQVLFASAAHKEVYVLTFTDKVSTFDDHAADWSRAVDSFAVLGEPALSAPGAGFPWGTAVLVAGAAALAVSVVASLWLLRTPKRIGPGAARVSAAPQPPPPEAIARSQETPAPEGEGLWLPVGAARPRAPSAASKPGEAPPLSLGAPPLAAASRGSPLRAGGGAPANQIACPRCRGRFPPPRERPANVVCPHCGVRGTLK